MPQELINRCKDLGITVEIVRGKVVCVPTPPADLLCEMKSRRDEIVAFLCPQFKNDQEFDNTVRWCAQEVARIYPDAAPRLESISEPVGLALATADEFWSRRQREREEAGLRA